jgi:hypothetical protein
VARVAAGAAGTAMKRRTVCRPTSPSPRAPGSAAPARTRAAPDGGWRTAVVSARARAPRRARGRSGGGHVEGVRRFRAASVEPGGRTTPSPDVD